MSMPKIDPARDLQLLSSMYLCKPTREAINGWKMLLADDTSDQWAELILALQAIDLGSEAALEDLLWDYTRLFLGPYKLPCPPWESVYTSQKRLLMQDAADATQALYAEFGLAVEDANVMPDHIGAELGFLAQVLERMKKSDDESVKCSVIADKFLSEHLMQWIPSFTQDLVASTETPLYRALAHATMNILEALNRLYLLRRSNVIAA